MSQGSRLASFTLSAVVLPSCIAYDFERPPERSTTERKVVVAAAKPTPADILFVVDNSGSMADEQINLARNFGAFIAQLAGSGDYQIGIISTDVSDANLPLCAQGQTAGCDAGERGGLTHTSYSPQFPYVAGPPDVSECAPLGLPHGCLRGLESKIITSDMARSEQARLFEDNVKVGSCGSGQEQGLNAVLLALSPDRLATCNSGFSRDDANLVIIFVTDENDDDPARTPIQTVADRLFQIKSPSRVRVAVIGGVTKDGAPGQCRIGSDGGPATCGDLCSQPPAPGSHIGGCSANPGVCPAGEFCDRALDRCENEDLAYWDNCHWCSYYSAPGCCSALSGDRYVELALAAEQRIAAEVPGISRAHCRAAPEDRAACLVDSICQMEFAGTLERIAKELIVPSRLELDPPAVFPRGVSVSLGDQKLSYGSDFTVTDDGVEVELTKAPGEGQDIVVSYVIAECGNGVCENPGGESPGSCPADCR